MHRHRNCAVSHFWYPPTRHSRTRGVHEHDTLLVVRADNARTIRDVPTLVMCVCATSRLCCVRFVLSESMCQENSLGQWFAARVKTLVGRCMDSSYIISRRKCQRLGWISDERSGLSLWMNQFALNEVGPPSCQVHACSRDLGELDPRRLWHARSPASNEGRGCPGCVWFSHTQTLTWRRESVRDPDRRGFGRWAGRAGGGLLTSSAVHWIGDL